MCCGQSRHQAAATSSPQPTVASTPAIGSRAPAPHSPARPAPSNVQPEAAVTLQYRDRSAVSVVGPVTGKRYRFLAGASMQAVQRQDAEALLATGLFRRVWS